MSNRAEIERGVWGFDFSGKQLEAYFGGFEDDAWVTQPYAGANHALWHAGHLALAYNGMGGMLGEMAPLPDGHERLFNMGSEPLAGLGDYPAPGTVMGEFRTQRARLREHLSALDPAMLDEELKPEGIVRTRAQLLSFLPIHDATHAGQIAMIRKHLGMGRVFG